MNRWVEMGRALTPEGDELNLRQRGDEFEIRFNGWEVMSSRSAVSEKAFAQLICEQLHAPSPWILIGGLGMGYTLRATLDAASPNAHIVVSELVPEIVAWNRGPLAELTRRPLDDLRVEVRTDGVVEVLQACQHRCDAILLDVDNGPDAVLYEPNRFLYSPAGLELMKHALVLDGIVGVWSADHSPAFECALETARMKWRKVEVNIKSHGGGLAHTIYLARRDRVEVRALDGRMSKLRKREQAAMEVVARHFCATWEEADGDPPVAYLAIAGKRIAAEVTAIDEGIAAGGLSKPRLRSDKVALRLVGALRAALSAFVPDGEAVILTVTAPIRLPAKTAAALESRIRDLVARRSAPVEVKDTICGNQIRLRLVKGVSRRMPKVMGFVHNPDTDPDVLLRLTQSWLERIGAAADRRPPETFAGDRWLIVADENGLPYIETYRHICSELPVSTDFAKILMVLAGGRVETLDR